MQAQALLPDICITSKANRADIHCREACLQDLADWMGSLPRQLRLQVAGGTQHPRQDLGLLRFGNGRQFETSETCCIHGLCIF